MKVNQLIELLQEIPGDREVTMFMDDCSYEIFQVELNKTKKFDCNDEIETTEVARIAVVF